MIRFAKVPIDGQGDPSIPNLSSQAASLSLVWLAIVVLAAGCAAVKPGDMVPTNFVLEHKHAASVSLSVPRGTRNAVYGEGHWTSQLTAGAFADSLTRSLQESGVFSAVLNSPEADYALHVSFVSANEEGALNKTVDLVTKWILSKKSTGEDVFRENVSTTYTAKLGRAFDGGVRLRLANEGAARENIQEGIRRFSTLNL